MTVPLETSSPTGQHVAAQVDVPSPPQKDELKTEQVFEAQPPEKQTRSTPPKVFILDTQLNVMERLVALIEWIQSQDPFLGSELSQCVRVISFEPSGMTIAVPERQWSGMIDSAGALLRTTLNESFGTDYALTIHSCESMTATCGNCF